MRGRHRHKAQAVLRLIQPKLQNTMDILVVVTESHRKMFTEFFLASLPKDAVVVEKKLGELGDGAYSSPGWQIGVVSKLRWALEHAESHMDSIFVVSDIDMQFFRRFSCNELESLLCRSGADILFQREWAWSHKNVNTGFYVARSTPYVCDLLRKAICRCEVDETPNDQSAMNAVLAPSDYGSRWGTLPVEYYARSHGFPPHPDILLHHANWTWNVSEKVAQLQRIRKLITGGCIGRYSAIADEFVSSALSGRLSGILRSRLRRITSLATCALFRFKVISCVLPKSRRR